MKKVLFAFCAAALIMSVVVAAQAEVQNVKVSGDIRLRGYTVDKLDLTDATNSYGWVEERVRIKVEADLTDNVSTVVTLKGDDNWGDSGVFDASIEEAYVLLSEAIYEPLSLKLGRQFINYGKGMILSSDEEVFIHDAVTAKIDTDVVDVDLSWVKKTETGAADNDTDLLIGALDFADYEGDYDAELLVTTQIDDSAADVEPTYISLRGNYYITEEAAAFGEVIRLDGKVGDADLSSWAFDAGLGFNFAMEYSPAISVEYLYAAGDKDPKDTYMDSPYEYRYYGYVFSPELSNIHIVNLSGSIKPLEAVTLGVDYYYYQQDEKLAASVGDANQDNGGVSATTNGTDDQLGNEIDLVLKYDYTEDVKTLVYAGWFMPGDAYASANDDTAFEVRGELKVLF